jgi:hypothetical protein
MLHPKSTARQFTIAAALVLGLAGCSSGNDDYYVDCGPGYCSWFMGAHLVAVSDVNGDSFNNLAISDPWPGP